MGKKEMKKIVKDKTAAKFHLKKSYQTLFLLLAQNLAYHYVVH